MAAMDRLAPLCLIGVGVAMGVANWVSLSTAGSYFPKLPMAAPAMALAGLAMLVFPGASPPEGLADGEGSRHYLAAAPCLHKAAWIVAGAVGLAVGAWAASRLGYSD